MEAIISMPSTKSDVKKPRIPDGRERKGYATRALFIDAVIKSVARNGLEGTTVSRLAEFTGQSRGLISFHFETKNKLLEAAMTHAIGVYEESWIRLVVNADGNPLQRLHAAVDHDLDFAVSNPDILALWWAAWGESRAKDLYLSSSGARDATYVADLESLFHQSGLTKPAAAQAAMQLNSYLWGCWLQHHISAGSADLQPFRRAGHAMIDQIFAQSELPASESAST